MHLYIFLSNAKLEGFWLMCHFFVPVPVSKPRLWPLSSLVDRPTCWGEPLTVRCGCTKGTGVYYTWYQQSPHKDFLLQRSSDLTLRCGTMNESSGYYCVARNSIGSEQSDMVSVHVLIPANSSCIYVVKIQGRNKHHKKSCWRLCLELNTDITHMFKTLYSTQNERQTMQKIKFI